MSCLLPLIAGICLASPQGLAVEIDTAWKVAGSIDYVTARGTSPSIERAAVMMSVPLSSRFHADYGFEHRSALLDGADRGAEYAVVRLTWRPFR